MTPDGDSSSLSSSMTDLMTSLAVIFILLLVASLNNISQQQKNLVGKLQLTLDEVLKDFKKVGVEVKTDPHDPLVLLVIVPEHLFNFAFDKADIPPQGIEFLQQFTPRLMAQVCSPTLRDKIASVVVEGHADTRGSDKANLDRSQQRASAVVIESLQILEGPAETSKAGNGLPGCFKSLVSASGRGDADPILDASGRPDPDRSRRVIFKIRIRSIEQELTEVVDGPPERTTP
jgi:outer membrane protein OmpA-like peptidoglycan-associated protein